jgi:hypothetical protein
MNHYAKSRLNPNHYQLPIQIMNEVLNVQDNRMMCICGYISLVPGDMKAI